MQKELMNIQTQIDEYFDYLKQFFDVFLVFLFDQISVIVQ
jgi:hypothetical protein